MREDIIYNKPITMKNMMTFTIPTMIRMIFISMYSIVDGIVVANFVGSVGLSAINIVYPVLNIGMAVSFMFAAGSNAIIAKKLGEEKVHEANHFMSLTVIINLIVIAVMVLLFFQWDEKIYMVLGSDEELLPYCVEYGTIMVGGCLVFVLQVLFQNYLITADRANVALGLTIGAGILNIGLDLLTVGVFDMGLTGAAASSVAGMVLGAVVPLWIFFDKKQLIHFEKPVWRGKEVVLAMVNGSSEMVVNLSSAITTALFNLQMMALVGEKGVAAISAVLYLQFIFVAVFFGFTSGIGPIISYNYGADNRESIKKLFHISLKVVIIFSVVMFVLSEIFNRPLVLVFSSKDPVLRDLMIHGFRILALSFLFSGINIFASGFFTSLNNGRVSAFVSMMRTLVLETGALLLLPEVMGLDGVWWALPAAEVLAAVISVLMILRYRKTYGY